MARKLNIRLSDGKTQSFYLQDEHHAALTRLKDHYSADSTPIIQRIIAEARDLIDKGWREDDAPAPDGSSKDFGILLTHWDGKGSDAIGWLIMEADASLNISLAAGNDAPEKLIRSLPPNKRDRKANPTNRWKRVYELMESGGFSPPRLWPVDYRFAPYDDWQPGQSYWTKTDQGTYSYVWSENLGEDEKARMMDHLLGPHSGLAFGLSSNDYFKSQEEYDARREDVRCHAESIADLWLEALKILQEATAHDARVPFGVEEEVSIGAYIRKKEWGPRVCAAWLQYIRFHPETPMDRWQIVCEKLGISPPMHDAIRSALTYVRTARRGVLVAEYPWYGM